MLDIVILGTGSGIPTFNRNHVSIYLRYEGFHALFDCGEATQLQLMRAGINFMKIKHVFITHWHADHWAGIIGLLQTMNLENRRDKLFIYGPEADRFVPDILDLGYYGTKFKVIAKPVEYEGDEIKKIYRTKDFVIESISVEHSVPSVAYRFREMDKVNVDIKLAEKLYGLHQGPLVGKLKRYGRIVFKGKEIKLEEVSNIRRGFRVVYSGDTIPCKNMIKIARECDVLIHESTYEETKKDRMHCGAIDAAKVAKDAKAKTLVLLHFSRRYMNEKILEEKAKELFENTIAAKDFMRINLKKDFIIIRDLRNKNKIIYESRRNNGKGCKNYKER